ncbi:hypothetical protein BDK51DRAFT_43279 [Blyttiomyces helicus]|uniref:Pentacotripeptide-repeat region of PRORP domain-containing protein n=1 Tax=Blyttiomyces helicus TaxID=388810 RepID=A0A4P9WLY7_9FUNG|nr:hypothetical protein BDK51DRAFT_43279 [Blyttiomyces helicus]|eukprot:RKO94071.1 hypothetical protein BDK51DRAFT_43279 [Blyttiomyces helicus]
MLTPALRITTSAHLVGLPFPRAARTATLATHSPVRNVDRPRHRTIPLPARHLPPTATSHSDPPPSSSPPEPRKRGLENPLSRVFLKSFRSAIVVGDFPRAVDMFPQIAENPEASKRLRPEDVSSLILLSTRTPSGRRHTSALVAEADRLGLEWDVEEANKVAEACSKVGETAIARRVLERVREKGLKVMPHSLLNLVERMLFEKDIAGAWGFICDARRNGEKPGREEYVRLMRAVALKDATGGGPEPFSILNIAEAMHEDGILLDAAARELILEGCFKRSKFHLALIFWDYLIATGELVPTAADYEAMCERFIRAEAVEFAEKLIGGMKAAGFEVPMEFLNRLSLASARLDEIPDDDSTLDISEDRVEYVLDRIEAKVRGVQLNLALLGISGMITALTDASRLADARRIFRAATALRNPGSKGVVPYTVGFKLCERSLQAGHLRGAIGVFREMMACGYDPGTRLIFPLVKALAPNPELKEDLREILTATATPRLTINEPAWNWIGDIFATVDGQLGASVVGAITSAPPSSHALNTLVQARIAADDHLGAAAWYKLFAPRLIETKTDYPHPVTYNQIFSARSTNWPQGFLLSCLQDLLVMKKSNPITGLERTLALAIEAMFENRDANGAWLAYTEMKASNSDLTLPQLGRLVATLCRADMSMRAKQVIADAGPDADATMHAELALLFARRNDRPALSRALADLTALTGEPPDSDMLARVVTTSVKLEEDPELGKEVVESMLEAGVVVPSAAYRRVLRALASVGDVAALSRFLLRLAADGIHLGSWMGNLVVEAYVRAGRWKDALAYIRDARPGSKSHSGLPDVNGFNILLKGMLKAGAADDAPKLHALMRLHRVTPNIPFMTTSLMGCRTSNEIEEIRSKVMRMRDVEVDPKPKIWLSQLAAAYSRLHYPRKTEAVFRYMRSNGIPMQAQDWRIILMTWRRVFHYGKCRQRFAQMVARGDTPDVGHFEEMMRAALDLPEPADRRREVNRWVAHIDALGPETRRRRTWMLLVRSAVLDADVTRATELVSSMTMAGYPADSEAVEWLVRASDAVFDADGAVSIFRASASQGIPLSRHAFVAVLHALANAGYPERVEAWADTMRAAGHQPEPDATRMIIAARLAAGDLKTADRAAARYPIDPVSAHMVADRFTAAENPVRAIVALARIPANEVDAVTVTIAMWACSRAKWVEAALALWHWSRGTLPVEPLDSLAPGMNCITALISRPRPSRSLVSSASAAVLLDTLGRAAEGAYNPSAYVPALQAAWGDINLHKFAPIGISDPPSPGPGPAAPRDITIVRTPAIARYEPPPWVVWPPENVYNSYAEALIRAGAHDAAVEAFLSMGTYGEAKPSAKTVRTVVGGLQRRGDTRRVKIVRNAIDARWSSLSEVAADVAHRQKVRDERVLSGFLITSLL